MRVTKLGNAKQLFEITAEKRDPNGILRARKSERYWDNESAIMLGRLQHFAIEGYAVTFRHVPKEQIGNPMF